METPPKPHPIFSLQTPQTDTPASHIDHTGTTPLIARIPASPQPQPRPLSSSNAGMNTYITPSNTLSTLPSTTSDPYITPASHFTTAQAVPDWDQAYKEQERGKWREKVESDLTGWRGGIGTPRSEYTPQAIPSKSYYGQPVTGTIGEHLPKEIIRIERDWSGGEVCQFESSYPLELEPRISPNEWQSFINPLNTHLSSAYSIKGAVIDNLLAVGSLWISLLLRTSTFERELRKAEAWISEQNQRLFEERGLRVLSPRGVALQFLEIEYY